MGEYCKHCSLQPAQDDPQYEGHCSLYCRDAGKREQRAAVNAAEFDRLYPPLVFCIHGYVIGEGCALCEAAKQETKAIHHHHLLMEIGQAVLGESLNQKHSSREITNQILAEIDRLQVEVTDG